MKSPKSKPSKTILTLIPVIERLLQSLVVRLFHRLCLDASCRWSRNPPSTVNQTAPNAVKDYASERPDAGPNRTASPELARAFQLSCGAYARCTCVSTAPFLLGTAAGSRGVLFEVSVSGVYAANVEWGRMENEWNVCFPFRTLIYGRALLLF